MNTVFIIYNIIAGAILVACITMFVELLRAKKNVRHFQLINRELAADIEKANNSGKVLRDTIEDTVKRYEECKKKLTKEKEAVEEKLKTMDREYNELCDRVVAVKKEVDPSLSPSKKVAKLLPEIQKYCSIDKDLVSLAVFNRCESE